MARTFDVAIVGGGIAGGSLACVLARAGLSVLLLERQALYRDRVLGEGMMPWGVAEARRLGVESVLLDNPRGAVTLTHWLDYQDRPDPAEVERDALDTPLSAAVDGVAGILCVRHPSACESLVAAATQAGATVVRGVTDVETRIGSRPAVRWTVNGAQQDASCRLVVGADGKVSAVRRQASIEVREDEPSSVAAGMLTGGLEGAPATMGYSATETDRRLISFPQSGASARLYVCVSTANRTRFTGAQAVDRFLAAWDSPHLPFGSVLARGRQEGPCGTFPLSSGFVDQPARDGLLLIGDAAGWVDPLIGQGLSMAMRDARMASEVLLDSTDWSIAAFAAYVEERRHRLDVLALNARVQQRLDVDFSASFRARRPEVARAVAEDPLFLSLLKTQTRGPEYADRSVVSAAERTRLEALLYD